MQWVMAAALICGATLFTSCMNDDNPVGPTDNLAEKLIGKWMDYEADGQPALTTGKMVVTFVSPTKALYSTTKSDFSESQRKWSDHREYAATIAGNKVTLTGHPDGNPKITLQEEFIISSITANEIVCNYKHTTIHDGQGQGTVTEKKMRLKKIDIDYHTDIVGCGNARVSQVARLTTMRMRDWSSSMTPRTNTTVRTTADSGKP